ncbi:MAG: hypothetical protein FWH06_06405 [Oscillospiraceae bacterium]|nr:hypothetical protein [Oscillospiraceae bacterium]
MQFSKKICLFAMALTTAVLLGNFVLAWFGRETLSDVAIAVIGTFGGFITCGYFALSGARDCSANKHGKGRSPGE